ncbi:hypothetical protein ACSTEA_00025 [Vibrio vulnificus]|uniref:hypothetical protein n=1 Tax=Vibrio vulnificus TaxID=672 RepID=UPI003EDA761C
MIITIPEKRLDALLQVLSKREMPPATRTAVRLVLINGYSYTFAELKTGVTRKRIGLAVKKLHTMDNCLLDAYRL